MSSTSVHLLKLLLADLDRMAERQQISRNRLIVLACEALVHGQNQLARELLRDRSPQ